MKSEEEINKSLREVFPTLTNEELEEARFNLERYMRLVVEIVENKEKRKRQN